MKLNRLARVLILVVMVFIVAIALSACAVPNSKDYNFSFCVVTDIHVMSEEEIGDRQSEDFINYDLTNQKLLIVSEAIFKTFIDKFINSDQKVLLIAGDLTEQGAYVAHQAVAAELKRAEDAGKKVFVIVGNHDITAQASIFTAQGEEEGRTTSKEDFRTIYNDFGYSEANTIDTDSLSYTADIGGNYRLIAVDPIGFDDITNSKYPMLTERLETWILNQIDTAISENKEPIFMCHYPIMPHTGGIMDELSDDLSKTDLAIKMRDKGVKIAFTGHVHSTDIAKLTDEDGKSIYDIETGSLISYPSPYRIIYDRDSEIEIDSATIDSIKEEYLLPTLYPVEKQEILSDYQAYARNQSMQDLIDYLNIKIKQLKPVLIENGVDEVIAERAINYILGMFQNLLDLPLYESADNLSVEEICDDYDIDLPHLDFGEIENPTVFNLAQRIFYPLFAGNENVSEDEVTVLKYSVYSVFYLVAESDLYDILTAYDDNVRVVDLKTTMVDVLFETGKLEVVPLIYSVINTDIVRTVVENVADDAGTFGTVILSYFNNAVNNNMDELKTTLYNTINNLLWGIITGFKPLGIQVSSYIDVRNVSIDFDKFFDEALSDVAGGFFKDKAPDDLNIIINKETTFLVKYE